MISWRRLRMRRGSWWWNWVILLLEEHRFWVREPRSRREEPNNEITIPLLWSRSNDSGRSRRRQSRRRDNRSSSLLCSLACHWPTRSGSSPDDTFPWRQLASQRKTIVTDGKPSCRPALAIRAMSSSSIVSNDRLPSRVQPPAGFAYPGKAWFRSRHRKNRTKSIR